MWNMLLLYSLLGLSSFKGVASKWAWEGSKHWTSTMTSLGIRRPPACLAVGPTNFLPKPCLSSAALVALLCRWSSCSPSICGLRDGGGRQAAKEILDGFLMCSSGSKEFVLKLWCVVVWRTPCPHKEATAAHFSLHIASGQVDLCDMLRVAEGGSGIVAKWWRALGLSDGCFSVALSMLLRLACTSCELPPPPSPPSC